VIEEAHLDPETIFNGIERFARDHGKRLATQADCLNMAPAAG